MPCKRKLYPPISFTTWKRNKYEWPSNMFHLDFGYSTKYMSKFAVHSMHCSCKFFHKGESFLVSFYRKWMTMLFFLPLQRVDSEIYVPKPTVPQVFQKNISFIFVEGGSWNLTERTQIYLWQYLWEGLQLPYPPPLFATALRGELNFSHM